MNRTGFIKTYWLLLALLGLVCSCGKDGDIGELPVQVDEPAVFDPSSVAVTGQAIRVGPNYADLSGTVHLEGLDASVRASAEVGVEVSMYADFKDAVRAQPPKQTEEMFYARVYALKSQMTYYFRTYVQVGDVVYRGRYRWFRTTEQAIETDHHEFVDLGLSDGTLWATMNIGATSPEEFGYFVCWGETFSKYSYDVDNYKWWDYVSRSPYYIDYDGVSVKKYCAADGLTELLPEDDVAQCWGSKWQTPSKAQMEVLLDECKWLLTKMNDVTGYLVVSKKNDNRIFLPAAGFYIGHVNYSAVSPNGEMNPTCECGYYWTRTLEHGSEPAIGAYCLMFRDKHDYEQYKHWLTGVTREMGLTVRAVRVKK
ncbi:MAG: hypothetical protein Q4E32_06245 [Bacteroidales bacterium]|nr:hypothetical protein [Bacteroidales bacterium]